MSITLDGATGITAPLFDGVLDASDLTGDVAAARITGALNASGSAPIYACRAWVKFSGEGVVSISQSGNVSSITDNGVGDYTVNFATSVPDANYSAISNCADLTTGTTNTQYTSQPSGSGTTAFATAGYRLWTKQGANNTDTDVITVAIFR